ncbi:MAG: L,D-transpeptidase family protein, partial [Rubrivivax sp.]|nr:L,D-transpeptidase family protein [Rubrivivax sp.]
LALQAVERLAAAGSHGLDPLDYEADSLRLAVMQALQGPVPEAAAAEQLEQALTAAMQRYLTHLHSGRVDPRQVHHNFALPRQDVFDPVAVLLAALVARRLDDAEQAAAPRLPMYERLRGALARYRVLVDHAAWRRPLPPLPRPPRSRVGKLEPGQPYDGLALLAERLVALGDLGDAAPVAPPASWTPPASSASAAQRTPAAPAAPVYEAALVDAVKGFQQRHGLTADGIIGAATLKQLQVAPAERVRQIELTLERLRWTPLLQGPRMIVINIPEFVLRAYEVQDGRIGVQHAMKVIVGKAMDTRTPLFDEDMRFIEFSPYWNVPPSIARGELVPRLRRDPGYFARQGFEFVAASGRVDTTLSAAALDAVLAGRQRIRQRPGPQNALGDIKFVFPNRNNIYLHHTPATQLFERDRRDFSHGCIRVEQPLALAGFVLQGMPEWTEERVRQTMAAGASSTLRLTQPVRVLIAYGTVLVKDGRTYFYDDIYGHDRLLDAALQRRTPERRSPATRP